MANQVFDKSEMNEEAQAELSRVPDGHPFAIINLLRYKDWAEYPPGTVTDKPTGREAYARYSELTTAGLNRVGAYPVWRGEFSAHLIGPADERWDEILIVQYPRKSAFEQMIADPEYRKVVFHRTAGIKDSRLYGITSPQAIGQAKWELFKIWEKLHGRV
jgi:uncharacterized protein (DUF1330 family)